MRDDKNELESIKACVDIINRLAGIISDLPTKKYIITLKDTLLERKKEHTSQQPTKLSVNKFRRRSVSLKKI